MDDSPKPSPLSTLRLAAPNCVAAALVFLVGGVWGFLQPETILAQLESLQDFAESLKGEPAWSLAAILFAKNSTAAVFTLLLGPLFGVFPTYSAVVNGAVVGAVIQAEPAAAWMVLPHGIFELPAMFLAWGLGMWTGAGLWGSAKSRTVGQRFRAIWPVFFSVVIPLLLIAAVIEAVLIVYYPG
jgi:uncharacterized membrane protein SpoIIM required for sporulation